jgi:ABC-type glutathione transport system ATPase component
MEEVDQCDLALITVGNSGSGKTLMVNIILNTNLFEHKWGSRSVTRLTEPGYTEVNDMRTAVFNSPGLQEMKSENVQSNKEQIAKAFSRPPKQVILAVFSVAFGGRILGEDVATYTAVLNAFELRQASTVFIINNVAPQYNNVDNITETIIFLKESIQWPTDVPFNVVVAEQRISW